MQTKFINIIILFLVSVLQNIFFNDFFLNLYLLLLLIIISDEDYTKGGAYYFALFGGLIYDLFLSTTLGVGMVLFLILAFICKKLRMFFHWRELVFAIVYLIACILFEGYHYRLFLLDNVDALLMGRYMSSVTWQFIGGYLIYIVFRYVQENIWPKKI